MLTAERPSTAHVGVGDDRPAASASRPSGGRHWVDPGATAALALVTVASTAGLSRVFAGHAWVGPVVGTAVAVHVAAWVLRVLRAGKLPSSVLGMLAAALMVVWTVFGWTTRYGFLTGSTLSHVRAALRDLGPQFSATVPPVAPIAPFVMVAAAGAGAAALLADWAAFRWRSPLLALVPGMSAFLAAGVSGRGSPVGPVLAETSAMLLWLLVDRRNALRRQAWLASDRRGVDSWLVLAGGLPAVAAVVVAAIVAGAIPPVDGQGLFGWRSGANAGGERVVPNPLVSLRTRLLQESNVPVFAVQSTEPSYWRLTSLDTLQGDTWTSNGAYRNFGSRLPGAGSYPPGTRPVTATFQIQQLESVWLPEQFDPVAVSGVRHVSYDPGSGSLLAPGSTSDGMQYTVSSYQYLATLDPVQLEAAPAIPAGEMEQDLQLPAGIDPSITALAVKITAGARTEYDKALALQAFLRGRPFTYTLDPPADGAGLTAVDEFLFSTHAGYCQQFAGAYAVLARAVGLPTRLAVGFDTGQSNPGLGYQVYDRDAHTWPEVWFGPRFGWLPFEPTPGFAVPGTSGYSHTAAASAQPAPTPATTVPASSPTTLGATTHSSVPRPHPQTGTTVPRSARRGPSGAWWVLGALVGAVALWVAGVSGLRRASTDRRRRRASAEGPAAEVLQAWDEASWHLSWKQLRRRPDETFSEFGTRAGRSFPDHEWPAGGPEMLASLAARAAYGSSASDQDAAEARRAASEIGRRVGAARGGSGRVRYLLWFAPGQVRLWMGRGSEAAGRLRQELSPGRSGRSAGASGG